ncbi:unnamed protein product [Allacma fusca]|uniref:Uncharacterized protein n=1 Tax=Allacma fusca TaxID=39272 RepID=A0A8J2JM94_9HEXA|nr:unnamed protein product [Allacma fusca]
MLMDTQKSHTPELALKRYLATLLQVKLWYDSDISDDLSRPFFTSLSTVRKIHHGMGQQVQAQHPDF